MPGDLRRGFPLHGDTAGFRATKRDVWVLALIAGIYLLGITVILLVLLASKAHWVLLASLGGAGAMLFYLGLRNKTTWRLKIKRSAGMFLVTRNGVPVPPSSLGLGIHQRPAIGYSLAVHLEDGPTIHLAASKNQSVLESLRDELARCLAKSAAPTTA
jgi:hypothetical protein